MDTLIQNDQPAPDFTLLDLDGIQHTLTDYRGRVVIINFWSAECPHVQRTDQDLAPLLKDWGDGVIYLAVASNANETPDLLRGTAKARGVHPLLLDPQQKLADIYGAVTTPHVFVIDQKGILRYQGAFDNTSFQMRTPTQFYLRDAVEAVLAGKIPDPASMPSYGCTVVRYAQL